MIDAPVVVDASVVVEYLVVLTFPEQATRLFREVADPDSRTELWVPDLVFPEVASALRKLVLRKAITGAAGRRSLGSLARLPLVVTGTAGLMADAWELAGNLTIYDATYLALARRLGSRLVTCDERLARAPIAKRDEVLSLRSL